MQAPLGLTVGEAAMRLGISPQRVHALVRGGVLDATRAGRQVLIDPTSVERRSSSDLAHHRPLDPANAWALIALAAGDDALPLAPDRLSPWRLSRLRGRLRRASVLDLAPSLRRRAQILRLRADTGDVPEIAQERTLVRTGVSAAREHGLDIIAPGVVEAYLPQTEAARIAQAYVLEPGARPNVLLHVVTAPWPFAEHATVAPAVLTALDLYDSDDAHTKRAGREYLSRLQPA